jgi:hypothetical protein
LAMSFAISPLIRIVTTSDLLLLGYKHVHCYPTAPEALRDGFPRLPHA